MDSEILTSAQLEVFAFLVQTQFISAAPAQHQAAFLFSPKQAIIAAEGPVILCDNTSENT